MIRVKISGFIKRNKYKIQNLLTKLIIVAIVVLIATIILSAFRRNEQEENNIKESYIPTETVIKGSNISKEQYSYDINVVNKFLECCNNKNVEEAYNLLSDECKEELYPTIEYFKTNYYDIIFNIERQYNLHTAVDPVKIHLGSNAVAQYLPTIPDNSHSGFITGGFNCQYIHSSHSFRRMRASSLGLR